jgi:hypothetical protein
MPVGSLPSHVRRHPVFRFFASLNLALLLLAVIILASIVGTIYESRLTAEVARAYIYEAWWFDLWLLLLALNLAAVAFSRMPWKRSHTGFLLTHLGIIIILLGAYVGKTFGIEGSVTLFKDQAPAQQLLINQKELRVAVGNGPITRLPASVLNRKPTPDRPLRIGRFQGWNIDAIGFSQKLETVRTPVAPATPAPDAPPALRFTLNTALMGQTMRHALWLGEDAQSSLDLGLARIRLLSGQAPALKPAKNAKRTVTPATPRPIELKETIFVFAKIPDQQIGKVLHGGATGAKIQLAESAGILTLTVLLDGKNWTFTTPADQAARTWPLTGTKLSLSLKEYWPHFQLVDNKPVSMSPQPVNPAALVELSGSAVPASPAPSAADPHAPAGAAPALPAAGEEAPNQLDLYVSPDGAITYHLISRKNGESRGTLDPLAPLTTGWADWTFTVDEFLTRSEIRTEFQPAAPDAPGSPRDFSEGLLVRMRKDSTTLQEWVPQGWLIQSPSSDGLFRLSYGWKTAPLPFALRLENFEVERYPGSSNPSEFRSTLHVQAADGTTATGSCSMNQPMNYPDTWWRAWTGLTYKMSQASWNPENLNQSSIQILRDPGWLFKWLGSLILCIGIFALFYLRPVQGDLRPPPSPSKD